MKILGVCLMLSLVMAGPLAAHTLEPIGIEMPATAPRGRMFGHVIYDYERTENGTVVESHLLPIELEIGLGERTQLNMEVDILLRKNESGAASERGAEEIGIGVKHRFWDETPLLPDAAFEVEYAQSIGLEGNEQGITSVVILSKNINPRFMIHLNGAYSFETESEHSVYAGTDDGGNHTTWLCSVAPMIRVIPDRFMVLVELNGRTEGSGDTSLTLAPEAIAVMKHIVFNLAVPFGLTRDSPDVGVKFGISKLF